MSFQDPKEAPKGASTISPSLNRILERMKASKPAPVAEPVETTIEPVAESNHTLARKCEVILPMAQRRQRDALKAYKPVRDEKGHFQPGTTGNPLGRPTSYRGYVRDITGGGQEMIDHAVRCMRGYATVQRRDPDSGVVEEAEVPTSPKDQAEARAFLIEQGVIKKFAEMEEVEAGKKEEKYHFDEFTGGQLEMFSVLSAKARNALADSKVVGAGGFDPAIAEALYKMLRDQYWAAGHSDVGTLHQALTDLGLYGWWSTQGKKATGYRTTPPVAADDLPPQGEKPISRDLLNHPGSLVDSIPGPEEPV